MTFEPREFLRFSCVLARRAGGGKSTELWYYAMPYQQRYIWDVAAGILRNMYDRICRMLRVARRSGGPIGYIVPLSNTHQVFGPKGGYKEFGAEHRAVGWNAWLTFAISPTAPSPAMTKAMISK